MISGQNRKTHIQSQKSGLEYNTNLSDYDTQLIWDDVDAPNLGVGQNGPIRLIIKAKSFDDVASATEWMQEHPNHKIVSQAKNVLVARMGYDAHVLNIQ